MCLNERMIFNSISSKSFRYYFVNEMFLGFLPFFMGFCKLTALPRMFLRHSLDVSFCSFITALSLISQFNTIRSTNYIFYHELYTLTTTGSVKLTPGFASLAVALISTHIMVLLQTMFVRTMSPISRFYRSQFTINHNVARC